MGMPRIRFQSVFWISLTLAVVSVAAPSNTPSSRGFATVLLPARRVVLSAKVASSVKKHRLKEGERFEKGDVLTELDSRLHKQLLARAKAEYEYYKNEAARNKGLLADSAVGEAEYAKSVLMRETSKANYEVMKMNFERCVVRAPFAGSVSKLLAEEFESVGISQPLIEIIDDRTLLAVVHLPAFMRRGIRVGSKAVVKLDADGKEIVGRVSEVSAEIDPASRSFTVKIAVDNNASELVPGMSGTVRFPGAKPVEDKKSGGNKIEGEK